MNNISEKGNFLKTPDTRNNHLDWKTGIRFDPDNPTAQEIKQAINLSSNEMIPYSQFMAISLYGQNGYYSKGKVEIGPKKDFTTASSIEAFGAILGEGFYKVWDTMEKPKKFTIVEAGAGEGTMAKFVLSWTKRLHPEFAQAINYLIVEYSHGLIARQRKALNNFKEISWIKGSAFEIPLSGVEGVIVSNELLDAFPAEIVKKVDGEIFQKHVTIINNEWVETWEKPEETLVNYLQRFSVEPEEGKEIVINLNATRFQQSVCRALKKGAVLTIDYGHNDKKGKPPKPKAFRYPKMGSDPDSRYDNRTPYRELGNVDITADVNFGPLERVAEMEKAIVDFSRELKEIFSNKKLAGIK